MKTGVKTAGAAVFTLSADTVAVWRTIHGTKSQGGFVPLSVALLRAAGTVYRQCTATGVVRTLSTVLSEAVEDEKLPANPALRPGRLRRKLRDPNAPKRRVVDPYTRDDVERLLEAARQHYPEWFTFLLCGLRTGMRLGELLDRLVVEGPAAAAARVSVRRRGAARRLARAQGDDGDRDEG